jgi:voltage-gated potassium channel
MPQGALTEGRFKLLWQPEDWLDTPMPVLGFAKLVLLVMELVWGLTPLRKTIGTAIWATFLLDFALRLPLAARKLAFLRQRWLTAEGRVLCQARELFSHIKKSF